MRAETGDRVNGETGTEEHRDSRNCGWGIDKSRGGQELVGRIGAHGHKVRSRNWKEEQKGSGTGRAG